MIIAALVLGIVDSILLTIVFILWLKYGKVLAKLITTVSEQDKQIRDMSGAFSSVLSMLRKGAGHEESPTVH